MHLPDAIVCVADVIRLPRGKERSQLPGVSRNNQRPNSIRLRRRACRDAARFAAVREPGVMSTTGHERQQAALRGKLSIEPTVKAHSRAADHARQAAVAPAASYLKMNDRHLKHSSRGNVE
jgi:hypothetical protein